jgi:ABC-type multidrug transport system fused ATPase/permease subunit
VSQEPTLFGTTVRENIAMGKPGATDAEIMASSASIHYEPFVSRGYHEFPISVVISNFLYLSLSSSLILETLICNFMNVVILIVRP